jgi:hypothetical protein
MQREHLQTNNFLIFLTMMKLYKNSITAEVETVHAPSLQQGEGGGGYFACRIGANRLDVAYGNTKGSYDGTTAGVSQCGEETLTRFRTLLRLARAVRVACLMLLLAAPFFSPNYVKAQSAVADPFNANNFTMHGSTNNESFYVWIPFYDGGGSDRYLRNDDAVSSLQYSTDGVNWTTIVQCKSQKQSADPWYWLYIKRTSNTVPRVRALYTYNSPPYWAEIAGTGWNWVACYTDWNHPDGPTRVRLQVYYSAEQFGSRPVAFRFLANWSMENTGSWSETWYLNNTPSPLQVWHVGASMHAPSVTGYTINTDGTVKVDATVPNYNEWDDKGTVKDGNYYNLKNIKIDNTYIGSGTKYDCTSASAFGSITTSARDRAYFNASHNIYADNGRYDLQPSYSYKLSPAYSVPPYPCPSNLTASANNGNVTLSWNMTAGTSNSITDNYQIYWRRGTGAWQAVSNVTKAYSFNETSPSVTFPYPETDAGTNNYQFLVARARFNYANASYNAISSAVSIATNKILITGINANLQPDNSSIKITWTTDGGRTGTAFRYRIYRKDGNSLFQKVGEVSTSNATKEYIDNSVASCVQYLYEVRAYDGANEYSTRATVEAIVRPNSNIGTISDLHVSKGFYNDRVNISWKVSSGAGFSRFSILRKVKNQDNATEQQIYEVTSSGLTQYAYDDMNATAGTYYDYRVLAWTECNGDVNIGGSLVSTGYKQPYGLVSGKVSYGTADLAVAGVSIKAVGESDYTNKSLEFNSAAQTGIVTPYKSNTLTNTAFTFQAWLMVRNELNTIHSFMDAAGKYAVEVDAQYIWLSVYKGNDTQYDEYTFDAAPFERNVYKHISVTWQRSGTTGTAILYYDGEPVDTVIKTGVSAYTFPTSSAADSLIYFGRYWEPTNSNNMDGYMDEIRLWNRALSAAEVKNNYNAYLSGAENGLKLYYRLDEQAGDEIFDISKQSGVFNENHGELLYSGGVNMRSNVVPDAEQLSIRTTTDANGAYILNTIPYTGDGSMFTISPSLGEHQFNPSDKPLFFNPQSASYSNINFSDISSFMVRGRVVYEGGNYPVKGCSFEVDGKTVVTGSGTVVTTDAEGEFEITVPIGSHSVRVVKTGHTFVGGGYLKDAEGKDINYNAPIAGVKFEDLTKVKLIGRVVGGVAEYDKPLGFGESKNNIGVETLVLKSTLQPYDFVSAPVSQTFNHNGGQWLKPDGLSDDATTVDYNAKNITIHVSPTTGEFVAMVYPEPYIIQPISVTQGLGNPVLVIKDDEENIDLSASAVPDDSYLQTELRTWNDSTYITGRPGVVDHWQYVEKSDSVRYAAKWSYKYQATPTFGVKQVVSGSEVEYFGEKTYELQDELSNTTESLELYNETTGAYLFGKPVFQQGTKYKLRFNAYEEYTNYVSNPEVTTRYPVSDGVVNLDNKLQVTAQPETLDMDSAGILNYEFTAGAPNLTTASGDIFATLTLGAVSYYWDMVASGLVPDNTTPLGAWQLGDKSTGTNFMTFGPDQITAILRDPPGTASSAYIEAGTSITNTTKTSVGTTVAEELNITSSLGADIMTFVGLGAGIINAVGTKLDVANNISSEQTYSYEKETSVKTTFTERFATSDVPDYVGAAGDVFIGNSTNILYGLTNGVKIKKGAVNGTPWATAAGGYSIAPSEAIAYGQDFATRFAYTEMELEDIMLPKWKNSIANRLLPVGAAVNTSGISSPVYVSNLATDDANFGKWNLDDVFKTNPAFNRQQPFDGASYKIYFPDTWTDTEIATFQDSILWANNQIGMWETVLAQNEKEKVEMTDIRNYSFGGGATIEYSKATEVNSSYSHTWGFTITPKIGLTTGVDVNGIGIEIEASVALGVTTGGTIGGSEETTMSTGFTLAEDGTLDEISVDYGVTASGTFAFKTRGGQTSCPYEGEVRTKYYHPGEYILQEATMQIEVPVIEVTSAPQVLNVPSNRAATFTLSLQNESETGDDVYFLLSVDEASNPNGAELKIDGVGVGNGRSFLVRSGETLKKSLTLNKGVVDDYDNIGIILKSLCDEISDTAWVTAHFVPACSDVKIAAPANNFIVNTETNDTVKVTIQGYDVNFPNFGYIRLEARAAGTPTWTTVRTFYPSNLYADASDGTKEDIAGRGAIVYDWIMKNYPDGQYELRATAASVNIVGTEIVGVPLSTYSTDAITGYKDMVKPVAMGAPSPADGIYGLGDELSVTFNENINTAMVIADNITVTYGAAATPVPVTFVTSSNKITVVYPEDYFALLEDSVITLTVSNIYDMRGNKSEPVTWQAYVNRNPLVWETDEVSLVKEAGAVMSFTAKIRNAGSAAVSYSFTGLPQWLSVNQPTGTLAALTVKELTFNISSGVNLGVYSSLIGLTSGNGIVKKLPLNLTVTGKLPDGWAVNPVGYESTMTLIGRLQLSGVFQSDLADVLAAFIDDECVGLTSPIDNNGSYYTFLTVYGNAAHAGKSVKFKLWDAGTGNVYSVVESSLNGGLQTINFVADATHGTVATPILHNALNLIEQSINIANGWNWLSVNVLNTNPSIMQQFKDRIGTAGEVLKGQNAYIQSPTWNGTLTAIDNGKMYMLKSNAEMALHFDGAPAAPATTTLSLNNGWNWLGYVPQFTLPVNEALANLTPTLNDQIKGQTSFRAYAGPGAGWIGTLNYLRSGEGYMYNSLATSGKTFHYPSSASQLYRAQVRSAALPVANRWTTDVHKFANSMTMISVVLSGGVELQSELLEIGAFDANGECRGSILLQNVPELSAHPYLGFLMVFGEDGDRLTFKVYDHSTDIEYSAANVESFVSDAIHGTPFVPYQLRSLATGTDLVGDNGEIAVYPNPVIDKLMIKNFASAGIEKVTISDLTGRVVYSSTAVVDNYIDVSDYASGVYFIQFTTGEGAVTTRKFVKK